MRRARDRDALAFGEREVRLAVAVRRAASRPRIDA